MHGISSLFHSLGIVVQADDYGVSLALSGILVVFTGLATLALFIYAMPKILSLLEPSGKPKPVQAKVPIADPATLDEKTLSVITFVLHAEAERASGQNLKVTLDLHPSPWALSGQMRILPGRIK